VPRRDRRQLDEMACCFHGIKCLVVFYFVSVGCFAKLLSFHDLAVACATLPSKPCTAQNRPFHCLLLIILLAI
jgi:hypothetical protein